MKFKCPVQRKIENESAPVCDCERYSFQNCKGNQTLIILASVKIKRGHVIG